MPFSLVHAMSIFLGRFPAIYRLNSISAEANNAPTRRIYNYIKILFSEVPTALFCHVLLDVLLKFSTTNFTKPDATCENLG